VRAVKRAEDLQQHLLGVPQYVVVGNAKHSDPPASQERATTLIIGAADSCQVLAAIELNSKPPCTAEEVQNVGSARMLPTKLETA
jgi:hypothetical protein